MSITKIDSAGAGVSNESIIRDSSKPGFVSQYSPSSLTEAKEVAQKVDALAKSLPKIEDVARDVAREKITKSDEQNAAKVMKLLLDTQLKPFKAEDFHNSNMLFYRYDAKDKNAPYDKSPLVLVLRKSRGYVLTLNLHWTPVPLRLILLKYVLQMNKANIRQGLPLHITYQMLKPIIQKLKLGPVIRLHIFGRISRRGVVVPPDMWLAAAKIRAESFSGGYSAEQLYKMATKQTKEWKATRNRRTKL